MLESISWQEFISIIATLTGGYYVISTLLFYSAEISYIFKQKKLNLTFSKPTRDQNDSNESNDLMGRVRYESHEQQNVPREDQIEIDDLILAPFNGADEPITVSYEDSPEGKLVQTVSTLFEEIKSLIEIISSGSRDECVTLFQTLLSNYPQLTDTESQGVINRFIYDQCKKHCEFQVDLNEINSWWPQRESQVNKNQ